MTAPLSPFFKYFGSKARLGKEYPRPLHDTIVEPFAGGAGYSLNYYERDVLLSDVDARVCRIWRYLIAATSDEIMALPLLEPGQSIHTLDVSEDARLFLSCCVNTSQFRNVLTSWKNGQNDGLWGPKWRDKVARQVERIKHWRVVCCPYWSFPTNPRATWCVDPPYEALADHYRASKAEPLDYDHLATWCRSRAGQVIVCEQEGASWLPFERLGTFGAVRGLKQCDEAVWCIADQAGKECPPPARREQLGLFG
jgi:hypothetical protein